MCPAVGEEAQHMINDARVAQDIAVAQTGCFDEAGAGPRAGDVTAIGKGNGGIVPIVNDQER